MHLMIAVFVNFFFLGFLSGYQLSNEQLIDDLK